MNHPEAAPQPGAHGQTTATVLSSLGQIGQQQPGGRFGRRQLRPILGGAAALALLGFVATAFWKPGFLLRPELDVRAADARVHEILTDPLTGYGAADVTDVRCNDGQNPPIKVGGTFTCEATIGKAKHKVAVTFADSEGSYWVGAPS